MKEREIVESIKSIRQAKKLSIGDLSKLAGLTRGYLSKIENSHKAPPLGTLIKIADALDTDLGVLISDKSQPPENINICIVRKKERNEVQSEGNLYGYRYFSLADRKTGKKMHPFIIEPSTDERTIFSHDGDEFQFVLDGTHEFTYGGNKYLLGKGDCVYFDAKIPHSGKSVGKKKAIILGITM